jgi:hypothetical protein
MTFYVAVFSEGKHKGAVAAIFVAPSLEDATEITTGIQKTHGGSVSFHAREATAEEIEDETCAGIGSVDAMRRLGRE